LKKAFSDVTLSGFWDITKNVNVNMKLFDVNFLTKFDSAIYFSGENFNQKVSAIFIISHIIKLTVPSTFIFEVFVLKLFMLYLKIALINVTALEYPKTFLKLTGFQNNKNSSKFVYAKKLIDGDFLYKFSQLRVYLF
jgi:hypothetical protein